MIKTNVAGGEKEVAISLHEMVKQVVHVAIALFGRLNM